MTAYATYFLQLNIFKAKGCNNTVVFQLRNHIHYRIILSAISFINWSRMKKSEIFAQCTSIHHMTKSFHNNVSSAANSCMDSIKISSTLVHAMTTSLTDRKTELKGGCYWEFQINYTTLVNICSVSQIWQQRGLLNTPYGLTKLLTDKV